METQKIVNLLNTSENEFSKFATKFLTKSIESRLCDYSDAYILITGNFAVTRQFRSTKPELRFWAGSNFAHGMTEIRDDEDL